MDAGQLAESASPAELLSRDSIFERLCSMQEVRFLRSRRDGPRCRQDKPHRTVMAFLGPRRQMPPYAWPPTIEGTKSSSKTTCLWSLPEALLRTVCSLFSPSSPALVGHHNSPHRYGRRVGGDGSDRKRLRYDVSGSALKRRLFIAPRGLAGADMASTETMLPVDSSHHLVARDAGDGPV